MFENMHPVTHEQLVAYTVNELSAVKAAFVRRHLAQCPECRAKALRLYQLRSLLRRPAAAAHRPPPATVARAKAIFRQQRPAARPLPWPQRLVRLLLEPRWRYGFALAALLAALGFGSTYAMADVARDALPGDSLYPLKTTLEDFRLALILDEVEQTRLRVRYTQTRAEEIVALAEQGRYDSVRAAAEVFEADVSQAARLLEVVINRDPQLGLTLARRLDRAVGQTSSLLAQLNTNGVAAAQNLSLGLKATSEANVAFAVAQVPAVTLLPLGGPASPTPAATPTSPASATPQPVASPTVAVVAPTLEPTITAWPTKTLPPTNTAEPTATPFPTRTPEPTATPLPTDTPEPPPTDTPEPPPTDTPEPTATPSPTDTPDPTGTPEPTETPEPTSTPGFIGKPTRTPKPTREP